MRKTKRSYKDSLFRDIFNNVKRLPEVYESLEGETAEIGDIRLTTMDEIFFDSEKNDVSFIVKDRHIVLLEHQSTVNANMPLRILWYIAELYRQYVDSKSPYRSKLIHLPAPKFYVFYNGKKSMPKEWQLRLSDAFGTCRGDLELIVGVVNINNDAGNTILEKCASLKENPSAKPCPRRYVIASNMAIWQSISKKSKKRRSSIWSIFSGIRSLLWKSGRKKQGRKP